MMYEIPKIAVESNDAWIGYLIPAVMRYKKLPKRETITTKFTVSISNFPLYWFTKKTSEMKKRLDKPRVLNEKISSKIPAKKARAIISFF